MAIGDDPVMTPDRMMYEVFETGVQTGRLGNMMTVPNAACRRIDVSIRDGTELAEQPPELRLRVDEEADRPAWWTPKGGPLPEKNNHPYD